MALIRRIVRVNASGTVSANDGGPGNFSVSKTGTGVYVVTFPSPVVTTGTGLCCIIRPVDNTTPLWARFSSSNQTSTTVTIYDLTGTATDSAFTFEMCTDFQ